MLWTALWGLSGPSSLVTIHHSPSARPLGYLGELDMMPQINDVCAASGTGPPS